MNSIDLSVSRRMFLRAAAGAAAISPFTVSAGNLAEHPGAFKLKYILGSCMYGYTDLNEIMPEVVQTGSAAIDIWPKVHGSQREQLEAMGEAAFTDLMRQHNVSLGCITQYKLGPFGLQEEMRMAQRLGCRTIITGGKGPKGLVGQELKKEVMIFIEKMKPHLAVAEETGITIAVENHANNLIESTDSMKWLSEFAPSRNLAVAVAPYHLPQDEYMLADLILSLGESIAMFYAWQHGKGCHDKLPKEQELLQMPGRGELDFGPLVKALEKIKYSGWTEIFMHPVPRGVPILDSTSAVTAEINRSRAYLEHLLAK